MFRAVTWPKSSEREPSTTKSSSSPAWRCSGSLAPASMRLSTACRFVAESAQRLLARTPGCRSCHARSLIEMIWDSGVVVVLISGASAGRIGGRESRLLRLELQVLVRRLSGRRHLTAPELDLKCTLHPPPRGQVVTIGPPGRHHARRRRRCRGRHERPGGHPSGTQWAAHVAPGRPHPRAQSPQYSALAPALRALRL